MYQPRLTVRSTHLQGLQQLAHVSLKKFCERNSLRIPPLQHTPNDPSSALTFVLILATSRRRPPAKIPLPTTGDLLATHHFTLRRLHNDESRRARRPEERIERIPSRMQARDEMRTRRGRACQHGADRPEQRRVLSRVPERVGREDDVGWWGQERGRIGAPGVRDDGTVLSDVVAHHVLAERVDELCVGEVAGDDADVGMAFGDEDAGQAGSCAELYQTQWWRVGIGRGGFFRWEIKL